MKDLKFTLLLQEVKKKLEQNEPLEQLPYSDEQIAEALWILQNEKIATNYEYTENRQNY